MKSCIGYKKVTLDEEAQPNKPKTYAMRSTNYVGLLNTIPPVTQSEGSLNSTKWYELFIEAISDILFFTLFLSYAFFMSVLDPQMLFVTKVLSFLALCFVCVISEESVQGSEKGIRKCAQTVTACFCVVYVVAAIIFIYFNTPHETSSLAKVSFGALIRLIFVRAVLQIIIARRPQYSRLFQKIRGVKYIHLPDPFDVYLLLRSILVSNIGLRIGYIREAKLGTDDQTAWILNVGYHKDELVTISPDTYLLTGLFKITSDNVDLKNIKNLFRSNQKTQIDLKRDLLLTLKIKAGKLEAGAVEKWVNSNMPEECDAFAQVKPINYYEQLFYEHDLMVRTQHLLIVAITGTPSIRYLYEVWSLYRLHCSGGYHDPIKLEGREFISDEKSYNHLCSSFPSYATGLHEHLKVSLIEILFPMVLVLVILFLMSLDRIRYIHCRTEQNYVKTLPLPRAAIHQVTKYKMYFEAMLEKYVLMTSWVDSLRGLLFKQATGQFKAEHFGDSSAFRHTDSMWQAQNSSGSSMAKQWMYSATANDDTSSDQPESFTVQQNATLKAVMSPVRGALGDTRSIEIVYKWGKLAGKDIGTAMDSVWDKLEEEFSKSGVPFHLDNRQSKIAVDVPILFQEDMVGIAKKFLGNEKKYRSTLEQILQVGAEKLTITRDMMDVQQIPVQLGDKSVTLLVPPLFLLTHIWARSEDGETLVRPLSRDGSSVEKLVSAFEEYPFSPKLFPELFTPTILPSRSGRKEDDSSVKLLFIGLLST